MKKRTDAPKHFTYALIFVTGHRARVPDILLVYDTAKKGMNFDNLPGGHVKPDKEPYETILRKVYKKINLPLEHSPVHTTYAMSVFNPMTNCWDSSVHLFEWHLTAQEVGRHIAWDKGGLYTHNTYLVMRTPIDRLADGTVLFRPSMKDYLKLLNPSMYRVFFG